MICRTDSALQTEGPNTHTKPFIQFAKRPGDFCDTKVVGISANDRVKISEDSIDVSPLIAPGHKSDSVFKSFKGLRSDTKAEASKVKPEKVKTLMEIRETSFRLMERELEISQDLLSVSQGMSGFLGRAGEDDKIIGVSDVPPAFGLDGFIEGIENNVGEQRRDDAPLRTALGRDADDAIFTDTGFEEGLDKTDNAAVCDAGTNKRYNNLVDKTVEGTLDTLPTTTSTAIPTG